jgi:hypothetical protein
MGGLIRMRSPTKTCFRPSLFLIRKATPKSKNFAIWPPHRIVDTAGWTPAALDRLNRDGNAQLERWYVPLKTAGLAAYSFY